MPRLTASLDVQVSSSLTEALPNVIGEAMACGVPCAVTDVGDSALARRRHRPGRAASAMPAALAQACIASARPASRRTASCSAPRCRRHILEHFLVRADGVATISICGANSAVSRFIAAVPAEPVPEREAA